MKPRDVIFDHGEPGRRLEAGTRIARASIPQSPSISFFGVATREVAGSLKDSEMIRPSVSIR